MELTTLRVLRVGPVVVVVVVVVVVLFLLSPPRASRPPPAHATPRPSGGRGGGGGGGKLHHLPPPGKNFPRGNFPLVKASTSPRGLPAALIPPSSPGVGGGQIRVLIPLSFLPGAREKFSPPWGEILLQIGRAHV